MLQYGRTSKTNPVKEASHNRPHTMCFIYVKYPQHTNPQSQKARSECLMETVSFGGDENVLDLVKSEGCTTF